MSGDCPEEAARPATAGDLDALEASRIEARDGIAGSRGGAAFTGRDHPADAVDRILAAALEGSDDALALVGTLDGMVVGHLILEVVPDPGSGPVAVIHELWVTPPARELGVGACLIDAATSWATSTGCKAVDADALPGDRDTKNFFEAHGMVARGIRVSRLLT